MANMNRIMNARRKIWERLSNATVRFHAACDAGKGYAWLAAACHKRIGQLEDAHERLDRRIYNAEPATGDEKDMG